MLLELVDVAKAYRGGPRGVDGVTCGSAPGWSGCSAPTAPASHR